MDAPKDLVLSVYKEAMDRIREGVDVINGTVGVFYDDDGSYPIPRAFKEADFLNPDHYVYSSIRGEDKYLDGVLPWFFGAKAKSLSDKTKLIATPGGTGAVSLALQAVAKSGYELLIPSLSWGNYFGIAECNGCSYVQYENFDGRRWNFKTIREQCSSGKNKAIIVNTPCHNPTGYSFSAEDYDELLDIVESVSPRPIVVLDLAYIDYGDDESKDLIASFLERVPADALVFICFSFSKSLSLYGLRVGALGIYSKDKAKTENYYAQAFQGARGRWSNINKMGMDIVGDCLADLDSTRREKLTIAHNREVVKRRADIFIKEADECGLKILPYVGGFFICVLVEDALKTCKDLQNKNIFLGPITKNVIRVAISCMPCDKIWGLAKAIKEQQDC